MNPARSSRALSVIATIAAVALLAAYAMSHRAELKEIYDELRQAIPLASQELLTEPGPWLEAGPSRIDPQELAGFDIEVQDRSGDDDEREAFGERWVGIEGDFDTRDQILDRDLVDVVYESGSGCDVADGTLHATPSANQLEPSVASRRSH